MSATRCAWSNGHADRRDCHNSATRGAFCDFHAEIIRVRERCLAGLCRPSCTRGGCTTHKAAK